MLRVCVSVSECVCVCVCVCVRIEALLLRLCVVAMAMKHANVAPGTYIVQSPLLSNAMQVVMLACVDSANCVCRQHKLCPLACVDSANCVRWLM